ncbi:MAG: endo-1,4-beta-xylanase [Candidatus Promineifilaceae bacterium]
MRKLRLFGLGCLLILLMACGGDEPAVSEPEPEPEVVVVEEGAAAEPTAAPTDVPEPVVEPTLPPPVVVESDEAIVEEAVEEDAPSAEEAVVEADTPPIDLPMINPVGYADGFGYGIQSHATIGDPAYAMEVVANQLNLNWVKVQMRWAVVQSQPDSYDWGIWDAIVNEADAKGVKLMLSIVTSPSWSRAAGDEHGPPDDYNLYHEFVMEVATRYQGRVHAIEVWNEQNLDREWVTDQGVAPITYVEFIQGAYAAIKGVDPNIVVISGALSPTGVHDENKIKYMNDLIWFDEALTFGLLDSVDCVGVHHNGYNLPPNVGFEDAGSVEGSDTMSFRGPFDNPHPSWSFFTTLDLMTQKAQAVDPEMKMCVTEFGWATAEGYEEHPTGFEWVLDNTLEIQAQYIVEAYTQMRASGDVLLAFLFNFDYGPKGNGPTDDNVPYSILDTNGVPRPAFGAIGGMDKTP